MENIEVGNKKEVSVVITCLELFVYSLLFDPTVVHKSSSYLRRQASGLSSFV
jgi:hypothetical protein